jgi:hypothetical protein
MLISQSAAEGVNLVGVRQVHILEPYWNEVRIRQVIGRAARNDSHSHLPAAERRVTVRRYVSSLTEARHRGDRTLKAVDRGLTSDEIVMRLAAAKMELVGQFQDALERSAIDCRGAACAAFGEDLEPAKNPSPAFDVFADRDRRLLHVRRRGSDYIMDPDSRELYDYTAYRDTGALKNPAAAQPNNNRATG